MNNTLKILKSRKYSKSVRKEGYNPEMTYMSYAIFYIYGYKSKHMWSIFRATIQGFDKYGFILLVDDIIFILYKHNY